MYNSSSLFEYDYSDLRGPTRVVTHMGGLYFLTMVDDFSRRVCVHILTLQRDTFEKF